MSLRTCPKHGPYVADDSTDFGETWCPECGPEGGRRVSVSVKFAWYDLWVGAFIERHHPDYRLVVYVCPLPTLLFVLRFGEKEDAA